MINISDDAGGDFFGEFAVVVGAQHDDDDTGSAYVHKVGPLKLGRRDNGNGILTVGRMYVATSRTLIQFPVTPIAA